MSGGYNWINSVSSVVNWCMLIWQQKIGKKVNQIEKDSELIFFKEEGKTVKPQSMEEKHVFDDTNKKSKLISIIIYEQLDRGNTT